jgi:hypothetical protein
MDHSWQLLDQNG